MELSGKAKEDFEKWFIEKGFFYGQYRGFLALEESMQWGVLVEFFDSKGFEVEVNRVYDMGFETYADEYEWGVGNFETNKYSGDGYVKTLKEAQKAAIQKANEIYNSK